MRSRLVAKFKVIAAERLERLNNDVVLLEEDATDLEVVVRVLRELHTLKGESRMTGFALTNRIAHHTEELLEGLREGGGALPRARSDVVLAGLDLIARSLECEDDAVMEADVQAFEALVEAVVGQSGGETADSRTPNPQPEKISAFPRSIPKGETVSAFPKSIPAQAPTPAVTPPSSGGAMNSDAAQGGQGPAKAEVLRVHVDRIDELTDLATDLLLGQARDERLAVSAGELSRSHSDFLARALAVFRPIASVGEPTYHALLAATSEFGSMLERHARSQRGLVAALKATGDETFDRRIKLEELDERVRGLRLLPVSALFERFPRAVRDLASEQGKEVRVLVHGGDVEVDKQVLDRVADPILHLIRNAVDHGIELPDERERRGKPRRAVVELGARQMGSMVEITVRDDGAGLDHELIRRRALERGLVNADEAASLSPERIVDLVFRSGFSTRTEVTDLSGRGVGLDVVRELVDALGGSTEIESEYGAGTTFRLSLPVSMVLSRALLVEVGDEACAFPNEAVRGVVAVDPDALDSAGDARSFLWDGMRIPAADMGALLGADPCAVPGRLCPVVIAEHLGRTMGFFVSRFVGEQQVVHRPLGAFLAELRLVQGSIVLPDGRLALVVHVGEVMRHAALAPAMSRRRQTRAATRVLVVDDSEFTRDIVTGTLRTAGFKVYEAVNGRQGLERFLQHQPDLLLTDLDMPVMDGFGLVKEVRALATGKHTPIVVFSTRGSDTDKARASELGADGYMVKSEFRESALVELVRRYVRRAEQAGRDE